MANTLRFKRGLVSGIPTAALGEPLFTTDTFDLYIGNGTTNTRFQKYIASGATTQILRGDGSLLTMPIVLTSPSNGQVLKYDGTNWVNSADAGVTGSGANGQVTFWNSGSTITGSNNLFWDATNNRLGIGTNTPNSLLNLYASDLPRLRFSSGSSGDAWIDTFGTAFRLVNNSASGALQFSSNGQIDVYTAGGSAINFSTSATQRARITSLGNFIINNSASDNGLRFQVTGDGYFSGSVGIGSTALTDSSMRLGKNITGAVVAYGILNAGIVQSDVTSIAYVNRTFTQTQATAFTLNSLVHYGASQSTIGAGSAVTNQFGFFVDTSLTGATNNYGFYGNIASGTGRWNLYMNGTAANYLAGSLGIGSVFLSDNTLRLSKSMTGATSYTAIYNEGTIQTDVTGSGIYYRTQARTAPSAIVTSVLHYYAQSLSLGAGSTVTNQFGFHAESNLIGATNNYGFYGNIASGTGRWNLYMNGSAANYLNGSLLIGTTTDAGFRLDVNGTMRVSGASTFTGNGTNGYVYINGNAGSGGATNPVYQRGMSLSWNRSSGGGENLLTWSNFDGGSNNRFAISFWNGTTLTENITAYPNGNVGINTSTPQAGLDINGTIKNHTITNPFLNGYTASFGNTRVVSTTNPQFELFHSGNSVGQFSFASNTLNYGVHNGSGTQTTYLTIASGGAATFSSSVTAANGVFNGVATYNLKVQNGASANTLVEIHSFGTEAAGENATLRFKSAATSLNEYAKGLISFVNNGTGYGRGDLVFAINNDAISTNVATSDQRMRITSDGNVGIAMTPSYKLDVTGEARVSNAIAIGTTPDTNKPFKILKNINGTVGINFENTSTGSSAFSAIQMGTDVTGGTKFTNLVYSSSGVTASGVYQPDGTSLINNGSGGLNFLGNPIRMYTGGSNGTLRWDMTNDGFITQYSGTNPSTNATDGYRQYSADVTAGNAAPHFRTENGAIIKLYQETTAVGNSTISVGGGNAVLDDTEFDGYTLRQIVRALRNQGILQ